jgi:hypothetical protein
MNKSKNKSKFRAHTAREAMSRPIGAMSSRPFEGAGNGRRLSNWGTSTAGPNSTLFSLLGSLRSRSRELSRNDPQICGALDCFTASLQPLSHLDLKCHASALKVTLALSDLG